LGFPTGWLSTANQAFFWRRRRGLKKKKLPRQQRAIKAFFWRHFRRERGFLEGESLASNLFTLLLFCLLYFLYFCLHLCIKNTKNLVPL
jgi:hypothetical protein